MACIAMLPAALATPALPAVHGHGGPAPHEAYSLGGHLEFRAIRYRLHPEGAAYQADPAAGSPRETLDRTTATLKLAGSAGVGDWRLSGRLHLGLDRDQTDHASERRFDELYGSWTPATGFGLDAGKIVQRWGRGHVWNPASFVERPKDPSDPRVAREGYTMLVARLRRTIDPATTVTFTPVLLPVTGDVNEDFGSPDRMNVAGRVLVEHGATDVAFQFLAGGSRSSRFGFTGAHDFGSGIELYGEWARISAQSFRTSSPAGVLQERRQAATSHLAGIQYRAQHRVTYLAELYRNGTGFTPGEFRDYAALAQNAARAGADSALASRAAALASGGFGRSQPMRNYLYLRAARTAPVAGPPLVPSLRATVNLDDRSYSLTPELLYSPRGPWGWRLRLNVLGGRAGTEYGEKRYRDRVELLVHHHF